VQKKGELAELDGKLRGWRRRVVKEELTRSQRAERRAKERWMINNETNAIDKTGEERAESIQESWSRPSLPSVS
jgi:hypothetical protein